MAAAMPEADPTPAPITESAALVTLAAPAMLVVPAAATVSDPSTMAATAEVDAAPIPVVTSTWLAIAADPAVDEAPTAAT